MRPFLLPGFVAFIVGLAAACGESTDVTPSQAGSIGTDGGTSVVKTKADGPSGLPCAVDDILSANCRKCHSDPPQFGAPMPLLTYANLTAAAPSDATKKVYDLAAFKIGNDAEPMPPSPNARLSEADQTVIRSWASSGAPRSDATCTGTPPPPVVDPVSGLSCTPNKTLAPSEPYELAADAGDQYVCWGVDITAETPTHIVGFAPRIDNKTITHHVVMYEAPDSYPTKPQACSSSANLTWRMVLGWAPGVGGIELPKEAGFPIAKTGTHYVVQMHYSNAQKLAGQKDQSKIEVCTAPPREFEADVLAFGTQNFEIPAAPPVGGVFTRDCTLTVPNMFKDIHLFTALPHMHKLGVAMSTTLSREGAADIDLGTQAHFDFNTQTYFPIKDAVTKAGDKIRTQCGWKNTTGAPVKFGEKTADEMCYSFTMYYPRISASLWSWATPALTSSCVSKP